MQQASESGGSGRRAPAGDGGEVADRRRGRVAAWGAGAAVAGACLLLGSSGCNIVTPVAYVIFGPGELAAEYKLPKESSIVILVDDPSSVLSRQTVRAEIGETVQEAIRTKRLVREIISSRQAIALATSTREGRPLSVTEIGRRLDAEIVISVTVKRFVPLGTVGEGPTAEFGVLVVDAVTGDRLWPLDGSGNPVRGGYALVTGLGVNPEAFGGQQGITMTQFSQAESALAQKSGRAIAELFYDVERGRSNRLR